MIAKVVGAACLLLVLTGGFIAIYDWISPWPAASILAERFSGHYRWCVGMSREATRRSSPGSITVESSKQRAYVVIPKPIGRPRVVAVNQDQDGRVTVDESVFGFWVLLVFTVAIVWGAWRWCLRNVLRR